MKTRLLKTFTFLCLLISIFSISANAQIVYTDLKPDQQITCQVAWTGNIFSCSDSFKLDLNNDSTNDYIIRFFYSDSKKNPPLQYKTIIKSFKKNNLASDGQYPLAMNAGVSISSGLNWGATSILFEVSTFCGYFGCAADTFGKWRPGLVKYLGLKLIAGGKPYYAWMRINVGGSFLTIYDYAYNSSPDSSILAGDTGGIATGIFTIKNQDDLSVYPNPAFDKITLSFSTAEKREIQITNSLGQVLFAEDVNSVTKEIDVSQFQKGLFSISVKSAGRDLEGKFLKQ